jgi:uncharacterized protein (DUF1919 family)
VTHIDKLTEWNDYYIYNSAQADYFITQGYLPIHIGIGKYSDVYIQFERNENTETAMKKWRKRKL